MRKILFNILERIFNVFVLRKLEERFNRLDANILDLKSLQMRESGKEFSIDTQHEFAFNSQDFINPKGSKNDFTRSPSFVGSVNRMFGRSVSYLDIGCANGGLVNDFLVQGNVAIGIEGSDLGFVTKQDHWKVIPKTLFNADVTKPFFMKKDSQPCTFDVIGAWEVLEHIQEEDLDVFFENVLNHLSDNSIFMASVAQFPDFDPQTGEAWHVTLKSRDWWFKLFEKNGLSPLPIPKNFPFPRGWGNPTVPDWDSKINPNLGFHVFLKRK